MALDHDHPSLIMCNKRSPGPVRLTGMPVDPFRGFPYDLHSGKIVAESYLMTKLLKYCYHILALGLVRRNVPYYFRCVCWPRMASPHRYVILANGIE